MNNTAMYNNPLNCSPAYVSTAPQARMLGGGWTTTSREGKVSTTNSGRSYLTTTSTQTLGQTVQSERILSSNIVGETMLGPVPLEENIQYVEVPVIEEVIRHIPKKEYVEIEKRMPKYEYAWVERVVEIPEIHIVDKTVEIPQIQEVIRHVPTKQIVQVPKEIVRRIPKIQTKIVEKEVEVPGEIIEVPKPYLIENKIVVPRYTDREVPTVVSQCLVPVISESETDFIDVELKEYNPYLVPVDVYVPRPVARQLIASSKTEKHSVVDVPIGQFNSLLKQLNTHVQESDVQELLVKDQRGGIPIMPLAAGSFVIPPVNSDWESLHTPGTLHYSHNTTLGHIGTTSMTTSSVREVGANSTIGVGLPNSFVTSPKYCGTATRRFITPQGQTYNNVSYVPQSQTTIPRYSSNQIHASGQVYSTG